MVEFRIADRMFSSLMDLAYWWLNMNMSPDFRLEGSYWLWLVSLTLRVWWAQYMPHNQTDHWVAYIDHWSYTELPRLTTELLRMTSVHILWLTKVTTVHIYEVAHILPAKPMPYSVWYFKPGPRTCWVKPDWPLNYSEWPVPTYRFASHWPLQLTTHTELLKYGQLSQWLTPCDILNLSQGHAEHSPPVCVWTPQYGAFDQLAPLTCQHR